MGRGREINENRGGQDERRGGQDKQEGGDEVVAGPPKGPKKPDHSRGFKWKSKAPEEDRERGSGEWRGGGREEFKHRRYGGGRDERDQGRRGEREKERGPPQRDDRAAAERVEKGKKPPARPAAAAGPATYIIVTVNDRLGTKASIPCLPSDTVGDFKKLVAAHIGRKPHEIMLKRQSERPFKDFITLGDYGVSNGVQLDLELDTGD
ncbi:ubiquitin-like protein [Trichodelitschia bisporula]|uniref:Ubiquitin-like modifier HUB1 n=1 Tax=Trichodelitschia bisporula TaxID=703511 RepID=A0A6G1HU42_9PEZI|nr:ubiquitin-like protein [Trichodelitschia bisporula]